MTSCGHAGPCDQRLDHDVVVSLPAVMMENLSMVSHLLLTACEISMNVKVLDSYCTLFKRTLWQATVRPCAYRLAYAHTKLKLAGSDLLRSNNNDIERAEVGLRPFAEAVGKESTRPPAQIVPATVQLFRRIWRAAGDKCCQHLSFEEQIRRKISWQTFLAEQKQTEGLHGFYLFHCVFLLL